MGRLCYLVLDKPKVIVTLVIVRAKINIGRGFGKLELRLRSPRILKRVSKGGVESASDTQIGPVACYDTHSDNVRNLDGVCGTTNQSKNVLSRPLPLNILYEARQSHVLRDCMKLLPCKHGIERNKGGTVTQLLATNQIKA